ncbi:Kelch-like protein 8 [Holothuria leucospilota]|uniref:Kelch-like protein 8 n=1 Tax=Holothuria leucospilota TaxID=206669 RepID=A0A9Q1BV24_HOLLE|nr:Kelch-like protein 8 [Holothuria leucospilota]
MIYFLAKGGTSLSYQSNTTPKVTLHRFEPVLSRIIKVRDVQDGEGLARLAASRGYVRAMTDDGEEIFCCGSIRVRSEESGRVAFKINWKKNTAEDLPKLPLPRYHHSAVVVDGDLFIIGGCNIAGEPLASVLILRKGQDEWEEGISMLYARIGPGVAVLGDYIYAVGGTGVEKCLKTVERYHVGSHNIWELVSVMNCSRVFAGVVAAGGSLFVFGGQTYAGTREDSGTRTVLRTCEKYDPCTDSWTALPDMSRGRCQMVTVTV